MTWGRVADLSGSGKEKLLPRSVKPKGRGTLGSDKALKCPVKATDEHQRQQGQSALCPREGSGLYLSPCEGRVGGLPTEADNWLSESPGDKG